MLKVKLGEFLLTVDRETAEKLTTDNQFATNYLAAVQNALGKNKENNSCSNVEVETTSTCSLWKSPKCPTEKDDEATLLLLDLRKDYDFEFKDKKTVKNEIWQKIADKLNEAGYLVGTGLAGREKVRQKFANLQSSYFKYIDLRKQTGEGKVKRPKFFDEVDAILGDKHKATPCLLIDSNKEVIEKYREDDRHIASCSSSPVASCLSSQQLNSASNSEASSVRTSTPEFDNPPEPEEQSRFKDVKRSVRPKSDKSTILNEVLSIQKQAQKNQEMYQEKRSQEFNRLLEHLKEEGQRRHEQFMALVKATKQKTNKRRHSSDSDSDD